MMAPRGWVCTGAAGGGRRALVETLEGRQLLSAAILATAAASATPSAVRAAPAQPAVSDVSPAASATGVSRDASITADLSLPNGRLDASTVNSATVTLVRNSDQSVIPAVVNTTGGGDAIILQPSQLLDANTAYTFTVTSGVKDVSGVAMTGYTETFTTGTAGGMLDPNLAFQKVPLNTATGAAFTCVRIGPDGRLYASTEDGRIMRFVMNADGTLSLPQVITSLQAANGGNRLITGFAFDPHATPSNPTIWVSNTFYALSGATNGPDFTGKLTVMSGQDLATVQDAVVNLPRSVADHVNNQPVFGPDGALYFCQAGENAYGAPDTTWGNRTEHLLSAAILRLETTTITPGSPLDAKTTDVGGSYNPYAPGAPLTIYADGIRNAYSLLWDSSGTLWAPANGSSAGGNAPAFSASDPNQTNGIRPDTGQPYTGPAVPGLTDIRQSEDDYLYKVTPGGYYGHPNPARGEYVLNGGNPTAGVDPAEFTAYPVGTLPDTNYKGYALDFGPHHSPDGAIEYHGTAFNGALDGKILVCEYSAGDDIVVLTKDANGNVVSADRSVSGFTNLVNPVDLVEDPRTGNIYVAELGGQRLTLLRPATPGALVATSKSLMAFNAIAAGNTGAAASPTQSLTITNNGSATLNLGAGALVIANDPTSPTQDAADFTLVNAGSIPATLAPKQSFVLQVKFTAPAVGIKSALLNIVTNDPAHPTTTVALRGIGTVGLSGGNEPGFQRLLDLYKIPVNVGDPTPDDTYFDTPPGVPNDEVYAPRFQKAGSGPVSLELLASFGIGTPVTERFGYYTPGQPTDRTELFRINAADQQTVNPTAQGATNFDPGSASFGLYDTFPHFLDNNVERTAYSEDALNTWDANVHRKMRTYPLKDAGGNVVPNAYVVTFEDYNLQYDSNDLVMIVRNVTPLAQAPVAGLINLDGLPASDRVVFNRIQIPNTTVADIVHDTATFQLNNSGEQPLTINSVTLSDATNWQIVNPPAAGTVVPAGGMLSLTVKFVATAAPSHTDNQTNDTATTNGVSLTAAGGIWNGTLTVTTSDPINPTRVVNLAGYFQYQTEHENEPGLQTLVNGLYGYGTVIASTPQVLLPNGTTPTYYGEEVASGLWTPADPNRGVGVRQLATFHNQYDTATGVASAASVGWYAQGATKTTFLYTVQTNESQSILPTLKGSTTTPAAATFYPGGSTVFGWNVDGDKSQDSLNTTDINTYHRTGHALRFYPLRDAAGKIVPNDWLLVMDYQNGQYDNSDYQDNVYLITNMTPAGHPGTPTNLQANFGGAGIMLQWTPISNATYYNVYRSAGGSPFTKINATNLTSPTYMDGFAPTGTSVTYLVTTVGIGGGESLPAQATVNLVGANNGSNTPTPTPTPTPTAPAGLTAEVSSGTQVALSWNSSTGADAYRVERKGPNDADFIEVASALTTPSFVDATVLQGDTYQYRVRAENAGGLSDYSNVATAALPAPKATLDVMVGAGANKQVRFVDADGTLTTISIAGPGAATLHFAADEITTPAIVKGIETVAGTNLVVTRITTTGTTTRSALKITAKGGNNLTDIGGISADASLASINAKGVNLIGGLSVAGAVAKVVLGSANNAAISVGGQNTAFRFVTASNVSLSAAGPIKSIAANAWSSAGAIAAPSIGTMKIKGDARFALTSGAVKSIAVGGSLHDSTITLNAAGLDLAKLTAGALVNTTVNAAGNLGSINAGSLLNSGLFAGVASQSLPASAGDFTAQGSIASVALKRPKAAASDVNSTIAAAHLGKLSLGTVQLSNGGVPFGVAAQSLGSLAIIDPATGKRATLKNPANANAVTAAFAAAGIDPADFAVRII